MSHYKGSVLIIDDQENWLDIFKEILQKYDLEISTAKSFDEAVRCLKNKKFHLALIDMRLKDDDTNNMEGLDILDYLKRIGLNNVIGKIVITGYGTQDIVRESFKFYKVDDFIPKLGPRGKGFDEIDFINSVKNVFAVKFQIEL